MHALTIAMIIIMTKVQNNTMRKIINIAIQKTAPAPSIPEITGPIIENNANIKKIQNKF